MDNNTLLLKINENSAYIRFLITEKKCIDSKLRIFIMISDKIFYFNKQFLQNSQNKIFDVIKSKKCN